MEIKVNRKACTATSFEHLEYGDVFYLPNVTSPRDYFMKIKEVEADDGDIVANAICLSTAEFEYFYAVDHVQPVSHAEVNIEE